MSAQLPPDKRKSLILAANQAVCRYKVRGTSDGCQGRVCGACIVLGIEELVSSWLPEDAQLALPAPGVPSAP